MIETILELEYGYVLPELQNQKWEIVAAGIKNIKTPYTSVSQKIVDNYTGNETILCQRIDKKHYRLIDGNHRYAKAVKENKREIKVLTTI